MKGAWVFGLTEKFRGDAALSLFLLRIFRLFWSLFLDLLDELCDPLGWSLRRLRYMESRRGPSEYGSGGLVLSPPWYRLVLGGRRVGSRGRFPAVLCRDSGCLRPLLFFSPGERYPESPRERREEPLLLLKGFFSLLLREVVLDEVLEAFQSVPW